MNTNEKYQEACLKALEILKNAVKGSSSWGWCVKFTGALENEDVPFAVYIRENELKIAERAKDNTRGWHSESESWFSIFNNGSEEDADVFSFFEDIRLKIENSKKARQEKMEETLLETAIEKFNKAIA